jgi:hypothetical protein
MTHRTLVCIVNHAYLGRDFETWFRISDCECGKRFTAVSHSPVEARRLIRSKQMRHLRSVKVDPATVPGPKQADQPEGD